MSKRRLLCFMSILSLTGCQTADSKLVQEIEYGRDQPGLETLDDDLEMIRAFGLFKAGDLLELSVLRDGKMHSIELKMTRMPPDRAQALARWIEESEVWFEQGGCDSCRERQKKQRAFQALERQVTERGIELTITRTVISPKEVMVAAAGNAIIPPELDLSDFPPLRGLIEGLRSGDSMTVRFYRRRGKNALMIEPVVLPSYLEAQLAKAKKW